MNLFLIGMRGSGKSTVAPILAEILDRGFLSTDDLVVAKTKMSIAAIMARDGEAGFRRLETDVLREAARIDDLVIDVGGGGILVPENRAIFRQTGLVVWLRCCIPILWQRIQRDPASLRNRPALSNAAGIDELHLLHRNRVGIYTACANYIITTEKLSPPEVAEEIARWFREWTKEEPELAGAVDEPDPETPVDGRDDDESSVADANQTE